MSQETESAATDLSSKTTDHLAMPPLKCLSQLLKEGMLSWSFLDSSMIQFISPLAISKPHTRYSINFP